MSFLGSIFKTLAPIGASLIPGIGSIAGPLVGGLLNSGGGGQNPYASLLAGQLTAQRIPGQTQSGEYTPPEGGFGTYNYIPTGAPQIDPALIAAILNPANATNANTGNIQNYNMLDMGMNNPAAYSWMMPRAFDAGTLSAGAVDPIWRGANTLGTSASDYLSSASQLPSLYQNLMGLSAANPYTSNMIGGASQIGQGLTNAAGGVQNTATGTLGAAQGVVGQLGANPYGGFAQGGANTASDMYRGAGADQFGAGQMFTGQTLAGLPAASQVLNTAFDPQNALYDRTLQRTQDQIGTQLARMGITDSGTGMQFAGDTLRDFNIDWQNNQLGRQMSGLQSYTQGMTGAGGNLGTGANLQTQGAGTYAAGSALPFQTYQNLGATQLGNLGTLSDLAGGTASTVGQTGTTALLGNQAGYNAYQGDLANQLGYLNAFANQGIGGMGAALGNYGGALNNQAGLYGTGINFQYGAGQLPYQAYQGLYGDQNTALSNFLANATSGGNLGNQSVQQMLAYLSAVNAGSANAANAASGAQTNTMNQNANAAAGLSPIIGQGLDWLGSLFNRPSSNLTMPSYAGGTWQF